MPDRYARQRETIAQLRAHASEATALADEMEAELPTDDDEVTRRRYAAQERARRLGISVVKGTGVGAAAIAVGKWANEHTAAVVLLAASGSAAAGIALAPYAAPLLPGVPESGHHAAPAPTVTAPGPAVTRTAPPPTRRPVRPSSRPSPSASPTPSGTPSSTALPTDLPTGTELPTATISTDVGIGNGDGDDPTGPGGPPVETSPAPAPTVTVAPERTCRARIDLPPVLRVRVCLNGRT